MRSSAAAVTDINASTETGDGGSDASRSAIPLLGTCSSALEAAHPDAKVRARKFLVLTNETRLRQASIVANLRGHWKRSLL